MKSILLKNSQLCRSSWFSHQRFGNGVPKNNCGVPKKNQRVSKMFLQEKLRKNGKKITVTFKKRKWIILVNFWVNTE